MSVPSRPAPHRPTLLTWQGLEFFMFKYLRRGMTINQSSMEWLEDRHKIALEMLSLETLGDESTAAGVRRRTNAMVKQLRLMWFHTSVTEQQLYGCLARYLRTTTATAVPPRPDAMAERG